MPPTILILQITLQALSAFAIAGGLLYTAFQFRQARKAQAVANFAKLVEMQYQLRRLRVEHPSLASVHAHDVEHLHSEREIQEYFLNLMQLSLFEIAWYAHEHGQLPADYFHSWAKRMWLGPVMMGSCRFLNVLLGMSAAPASMTTGSTPTRRACSRCASSCARCT